MFSGGGQTSLSSLKPFSGFTLAEVLITLGIIGIVAAMTLPTLVAKHRIKVTETSLKKFYTNINQAVNLSVVQNGETRYWVFPSVENADNPDEIELFFNKYLKSYIKVLNTKKSDKVFQVYFSDGSGVALSYRGKDWAYCINAKDLDNKKELLGNKCFFFGFYPGNVACRVGSYSYRNFYNRGVEPYISCDVVDEDGNISETTEEHMYKYPSMYTKIIQLNGWKIPNDYPIKF